MRCVFLTAGWQQPGVEHDRSMLRIAGLPLIERSIATASRAGVSDFYVVIGDHAETLAAFLSEVGRRRGLRITTIRERDRDSDEGADLFRAHRLHEGNVLLLTGDHVFDAETLRGVLSRSLDGIDVLLAAKRCVNGASGSGSGRLKILATGGTVEAVGSDLERFNALDAGILFCSPAVLSSACDVSCGVGPAIAQALGRAAASGRARLVEVDETRCKAIDTPEGARDAERALYRGLSKPADGFVSRVLNRKLSVRVFTPLLLKIRPSATPNQVSVLSFAVALAASLSFFAKRPVLGGVLAQTASILDGSDGEIARLKMMESKFGTFLDALVDRYGDTFILLGMSHYALTSRENARLFGRLWNPLAIAGSSLAVAGNLMVSYTSAKSVVDFGYRYRGKWTAAGRGRDLRLLTLSLGGVLGRMHPVSVFLALAAVAAQTNATVLSRVRTSWRYTQADNPFQRGGVRAIIYDLDGTIADTMPFLTDIAVGLMTENYGVTKYDAQAAYRRTMGADFASQMEQIFPDHGSNGAVVAAFEEGKREGVSRHAVFSDVSRTLAFFKERSIRQFVCSSTTEDMVSQYVRKYGLHEWVDACTGYRPGFSKGDQVQLILNDYDLRPEEVVFVTDCPRDFDFVRQTNVGFVGVRRLFNEREFAERGLQSVADFAGLRRLWRQARNIRESVEPVYGSRAWRPSGLDNVGATAPTGNS